MALLQYWENRILNACWDAGIQVIDNIPLTGTHKGLYLHKEKMILLDPRLTSRDKACTLLHEYEHFLRGDDIRQPMKVENEINRRIASKVINHNEFIQAVKILDSNLNLVAYELTLPRWVVKAYFEGLKQQGKIGHYLLES